MTQIWHRASLIAMLVGLLAALWWSAVSGGLDPQPVTAQRDPSGSVQQITVDRSERDAPMPDVIASADRSRSRVPNGPRPESGGLTPAQPPAVPVPASHPARAELSPVLPGPVERELQRQDEPTAAGGTRTTRLLRIAAKYPLIRIEAERDAAGRLLRRQALVADHLLVALRPGVGPAELQPLLDRHELHLRRISPDSRRVLLAFDPEDPERLATLQERLQRADDLLRSVDRDYVVQLSVTPDDPDYDDCWGLHNTGQTGGTDDADIDAPEAWGFTTGSRQVRIGVIDTGIDHRHPDLAANIWTNPGEVPGNGIDDDGNGYIDDVHGYDFANDDGDPLDDHGHGTHVAGTIGASGDNGTMVAGVAWEVTLIGAKFLTASGGGYTSDAVDAVAYLTEVGVDATNNSWGGGGPLESLQAAIEEAAAQEILFIAAAGNNGSTTPTYPADYPVDAIVTVAATDHDDQLAGFSNRGADWVDLAAPGVSIFSTLPSNRSGSFNGTSMATPHVTGVVALLRSLLPDLPARQVKERLLAGVDVLPQLADACASSGRLNAAASLQTPDAPDVAIVDLTTDEIAGGVVNDIVSPGETVALGCTLINIGDQPATGLTLTVSSDSAGIGITPASVGLADLAASELRRHDQVVELQIPADQPDGPVVLTISLSGDGGRSWQTVTELAVSRAARVTGRVERFTGGAAIADALIQLTPTRQLRSAADGGFAAWLPVGSYELHCQADGFHPAAPMAVTLPPDATDLRFRLRQSILRLDRDEIDVTLSPGETASLTMQVHNDGDADLDVALLGDWRGADTIPLGRSDPFGYAWIDSRMAGGPAFAWREIRAADRRLQTSTTTAASVYPQPMSFDFPFYDATYGFVRLAQGGALTLSSAQFGGYGLEFYEQPQPLPLASIGQSVIAPLWSRMTWYFPTTNFFLEDLGDRMTVLWDRMSLQSNPVAELTVQARLDRDGTMKFFYRTVDGHPLDVTVGLQNPVGDSGLQIARHEFFAEAGLAVHLQHNPSWLQMEPAEFTVAPGGVQEVTVTVGDAELFARDYDAYLGLRHNGTTSANPSLLPARLSISGAGELIAAPASIAFDDTVVGDRTTVDLRLQNTGSGPITITDSQLPDWVTSTLPDLPLVVPPGAGRGIDVVVTFAPQATGPVSGAWRLTTDAAATPILSIGLDGSGVLGDHAGFRFDPIASTQGRDAPFPARLQAIDTFGNALPAITGSASLSAWRIDPAKTPVRLTEIKEIRALGTAVRSFVEVQNVGPVPVAVDGWRVVTIDAAEGDGVNHVNPDIWTMSGTLAAGALDYRSSDPDDHFWPGRLPFSKVYNRGWVLLLDQADRVIDCVFWGFSRKQIDRFDVTIAGTRFRRADLPWSGAGVDYDHDAVYDSRYRNGISRSGDSDADDAGDWVVADNTQGVVNPQLDLPMTDDLVAVPLQPTSVDLADGVWSGDLRVDGLGRIAIEAEQGTISSFSGLFSVAEEALVAPTGLRLAQIDGPRVRLDWDASVPGATQWEVQRLVGRPVPLDPLLIEEDDPRVTLVGAWEEREGYGLGHGAGHVYTTSNEAGTYAIYDFDLSIAMQAELDLFIIGGNDIQTRALPMTLTLADGSEQSLTQSTQFRFNAFVGQGTYEVGPGSRLRIDTADADGHVQLDALRLQPVGLAWTDEASVAQPATGATDQDVVYNQTYSYRIRASDGSRVSDWSGPVSISLLQDFRRLRLELSDPRSVIDDWGLQIAPADAAPQADDDGWTIEALTPTTDYELEWSPVDPG